MDTYAIPPTEYRFRDAGRYASWLCGLLWADLAASAVYLAASITAAFAAPAAKVTAMLFAPWALVFVVAAILFLVWIHRAAANITALGADVSFDPAWAVGWLLIPVINLWMSFVVIEEIWRASVDARDWRGHHAPWLVVRWWGAWVAASIGATLTYFMQGGLAAKVVYFVAHMVFAWLSIAVVGRVRDLQQTQAARLGNRITRN